MTVMIVIPSYEPRDKAVSFLQQLGEQMNREILLIDDGSGPEYQSIFRQLSDLPFVTLVSYPDNKGKGHALKTGFQEILQSHPEVATVVTADSDGQHCIEDICRMIDCKERTTSRTMVLGTRAFPKEKTPFKSYWGNRISSIFFYLATGTKCGDTQTGLRAVNRERLPALLEVPGERFDYEMNMLLKSRELDIQLKQLPIKTIYEENNVHSHFRTVRDSYLIYKPLLRYLASAAVSSVLDILGFAVLFFLLGGSAEMVFPATIIARIFSGIVNYSLTRSWVFQDENQIFTTLWKYAVLFLIQMILSSLGVQLLMKIIPIAIISKIVVDSFLFICSFMIQNQLIFQKKVIE